MEGNVCVFVYARLFYSLIGLSFIVAPASVRTVMQGKAPSRLRVVLMMVKRWWVTGTRGHCVGDASRFTLT